MAAVAVLFKSHPLPGERLAKLDSATGDRFDPIKGATRGSRFYRPKC